MDPLTFEGVVEHHIEDSGQALILDVDDGRTEPGGESVTLASWAQECPDVFFNRYDDDDIRRAHPVLGQLIGRRVRVTVEVLD